jgi:hypothetical protein
MKILIELTGTTPLCMHNPRLADHGDVFTRQIKKLSAMKKKTDDVHSQIGELEFKGGLYHSDQLGPVVPGWAIKKMLIVAGRMSKNGTDIDRALLMDEIEYPVIYKGPRTIEELWADKRFVFRAQVVVGRSRVTRVRPRFHEWSVEATAFLDDERMDIDLLRKVLAEAGRYVGFLEARQLGFGRFEGTATER